MKKETKKSQKIIIGIVLVAFIGAMLFLWKIPNPWYQNQSSQSQIQSVDYNKELAQLQIDPQASKMLLEQVLPPAEVNAEIDKRLDTAQTITMPTHPNEPIKISNSSGKTALQSFLKQLIPSASYIASVASTSKDDLLNQQGDANRINSAIANVSANISLYANIPVPAEAAAFHTQQLIALDSYLNLLKLSKNYANNASMDPWPEMYKWDTIINKASAAASQEFAKLNDKYNLLGDIALPSDLAQGNFLIQSASAQLAVAIAANPWQALINGIEEALLATVSRFILNMLGDLINHVNQAYRVSNFLYYADALNESYVNNYLSKYVPDATDQSMIKNFIPAIACGVIAPGFQQALKTKADQYLGFDPSSINPGDPNYYSNMAKMGNLLSSPEGWNLYYQDAANQAQASAAQAAGDELNGSGYKSGRDGLTGDILMPATESLAAIQASLQEIMMGGGAINGGQYSEAADAVKSVTQSLLNKYLFGDTVVLNEQKACINTP